MRRARRVRRLRRVPWADGPRWCEGRIVRGTGRGARRRPGRAPAGALTPSRHGAMSTYCRPLPATLFLSLIFVMAFLAAYAGPAALPRDALAQAAQVEAMPGEGLSAQSAEAEAMPAEGLSAAANAEYRLLSGKDRYETAIQVSREGFGEGVEAVVVATGENYPDALSAAPLAAAYGGPMLLTHSAGFDGAAREEVARLKPGRIFAVGLQAGAVAQIRAAFPELEAGGRIVALTGRNRYHTAALVAEEVRSRLGAVSGVVIVPGDAFADALAVAPLAAFKGWPILLTPRQGPVPEVTAAALSSLGVGLGLVVGTYVNPGVPGFSFSRVAGKDRYDTCVKVAERAAEEGLSYSHLGVTTGENFPDALAAAPYLARSGGILLLVQSQAVPGPAAAFLLGQGDSIERVDFIGLAPATVAQVKALLSLPEGFAFRTLSRGAAGAEVLWLEQRLAGLTYRPGPIDGLFDDRTQQAVLAFQKWEGLQRDGIVGSATWRRLLSAAPPTARQGGGGTFIEIDRGKQVLLFINQGQVDRTLSVSTGNPEIGIATPAGIFQITRKSPRWDGPRYKPLYLLPYGVLAIHGYPSVPAWPASHGCVRVTLRDMDDLFPLVPVGTKVRIY